MHEMNIDSQALAMTTKMVMTMAVTVGAGEQLQRLLLLSLKTNLSELPRRLWQSIEGRMVIS